MRLCFDRGTILLIEPHPGLDLTRAPGVVWDPRVGAHRAPASSLPALRTWLHEAGVAFEDTVSAPWPTETSWSPVELRPYQEAALSAWEIARQRGIVALLSHAARVRIDVAGHTRALVRHARLRGLICTVTAHDGQADVSLELSGPFALFRKTRLYARALGEIIPMLAWCPRFRLRAECILDGRQLSLQLRTGDPIFPGSPPRPYDSLIEERFAREFGKLAPGWDVLREPEPLHAAGTLIFPDFALQHRADPGRRWLLEIVGFWTPEYVTRKLARYRSARLPNLILCIDEERNCAKTDLPASARVVRFRRRVDPAAVLAIIGG